MGAASFDTIYFMHIYRELNVEADTLSKEAQSLAEGVRTVDGCRDEV
jgi:hypothetical protein